MVNCLSRQSSSTVASTRYQLKLSSWSALAFLAFSVPVEKCFGVNYSIFCTTRLSNPQRQNLRIVHRNELRDQMRRIINFCTTNLPKDITQFNRLFFKELFEIVIYDWNPVTYWNALVAEEILSWIQVV